MSLWIARSSRFPRTLRAAWLVLFGVVLLLLRLVCPVYMGWLPEIDFTSREDGQSDLRLTMNAGAPASEGDIVWANAQVADEGGRVRSDSSARGLPLILTIGEPANDPLLDRNVRGLGEGSTCILFSSFDGGYGSWPTGRVMPEQGPLTMVLQVLKVRHRVQG